MKARPARDVRAAVAGADPTPAVDPERFQDDTEPYPGHWRENPRGWLDVDPDDPVLLAALESGVAMLPETWARAVRGHDIERRPEAEVAAELDVTVTQLRDLLNRGRAELREHLARSLEPDDDRR